LLFQIPNFSEKKHFPELKKKDLYLVDEPVLVVLGREERVDQSLADRIFRDLSKKTERFVASKKFIFICEMV
jgi:hypothetical protein